LRERALIRGSLNSAHIRGTHVPVEEPSTASRTEAPATSLSDYFCIRAVANVVAT
jgi:hypothetical protein